MEIRVRVERELPSRSFESKKANGVIVTHSFIGRTLDKYPKEVCFTVVGDERWGKLGLEIGGLYSLLITLESREWNGRYFTNVVVWSALPFGNSVNESVKEGAPSPVAHEERVESKAVEESPLSEGTDPSDLPF